MNRRVVYFSHMFSRVWLGLGALLLALGFWLPMEVFAQATIGGPCVAPVADHTCTDVTSLSAADRAARDCQTGRCPGLPAGVLCCRAPAAPAAAPAAPSDACGARMVLRVAAGEPVAPSDRDIQSNWVCRIPSPGPTGMAACRTTTDCYAINPGAYCCPPGAGTPPGRMPAAAAAGASADPSTAKTAAPAADPGISGRLGLPACAVSHDPSIAGRCTLNDIKTVAVNFANFLMGLAAAFFLAIFVWAGFKYIFFAYDSGVAADARKTLVSAAIGMLLVLGAATIVRFVSSAATGGSSSSASNSKSGTTVAPAP